MAAFRSSLHLQLLSTVVVVVLVVAFFSIGNFRVLAMEADSQIEVAEEVPSEDDFDSSDQPDLTESDLLRRRRPKGNKQLGYCEDGQTQCGRGTRCSCLESRCQAKNNKNPDTGTEAEEAGKPNTVTVINNCDYIVRVRKFGCVTGPLEGDKCITVHDDKDRFVLQPKKRLVVSLPTRWSGRFWGFKCYDALGNNCDCAAGPTCDGETSPHNTLAELTFDGNNGKTFYDLSLVDAYNLPVSMRPTPGTFTDDRGPKSCKVAACNAQAQAFILSNCPQNLQLKTEQGAVVGCLNECTQAQQTHSPDIDRLCCLGTYDRNRCTDGSCTVCKPNQSPCSKCVGGPIAMKTKEMCYFSYTFPNDDFDPSSGQLSCTPKTPGKASLDVTFCPA